MKLAIIGSRNIYVKNIEDYIPIDVCEIVSGGAKGVDSCAAKYAAENSIKLTEFFPDYARFGKSAPLRRNDQIAEYADQAIAFWDGVSKGTAYTIRRFKSLGKKVTVIKV